MPRTIADPTPSNNFAGVIAVSGDRMFASAVRPPGAGVQFPDVQVFDRDTTTGDWNLFQTLTLSTGLMGASITAMDVSGGSAIVRTKIPFGSLVIFLDREPSTGIWSINSTFPSIGASNVVENSDDVAILGNVALATHQPMNERVRVYQRSGPGAMWSLSNEIMAPAAGATDFGHSISFDGRLAVIGAPLELNGRVHVFRRDIGGNWTFLQTLRPRADTIQDFGHQVEHVGDVLAVSAPRNVGQFALPTNAGSVEVFRFVPSTQRWIFVQLLRANPPASFERYGTELALGNGYISVAANGNNAGTLPGRLDNHRLDLNTNLYRFERSIVGGMGAYQGFGLGDSLEISGSLLFAGLDSPDTVVVAPIGVIDCDSDQVVDSCEILLGQEFDTNRNGLPDPCEETGIRYCSPATVNSTGNPARMAFFGVPRTALFAVDLAAEGLPSGAFGYFMASRTNGITANPGMWLGDLCLGGSPISRRVGGAQIAGGGGRVEVRYNRALLPAPNTSSLIPILPGDTWYFQYWYRDPGMTPSANFSDAVEVRFTLF